MVSFALIGGDAFCLYCQRGKSGGAILFAYIVIKDTSVDPSIP